jgi:hypothetical protein
VTEEEIDRLTQDISRRIEQLSGDSERPLNRKERKEKLVLRARLQTLERIKEAKDRGDIYREARSSLDYALLTDYGEKNILLYNLMKARLGFWRAF